MSLRETHTELAKHKGILMMQHGIVFSDFGTRRRRSFAVHRAVVEGLVAANSAIRHSDGGCGGRIGRLLGTSNTLLAKEFNLAPIGTIAHEWTMGIAAIYGYEHSNMNSLDLWDAVYAPPAFTPKSPTEDLTIALTDTFSTRVFWRDLTSSEKGIEMLRRWRGLRQDSGDSETFVRNAIDIYRSVGVDPSSKLVIFSDGTCVHRMCADATGLNVPRCIELQTLADQLGVRAGFGACAPAPD